MSIHLEWELEFAYWKYCGKPRVAFIGWEASANSLDGDKRNLYGHFILESDGSVCPIKFDNKHNFHWGLDPFTPKTVKFNEIDNYSEIEDGKWQMLSSGTYPFKFHPDDSSYSHTFDMLISIAITSENAIHAVQRYEEHLQAKLNELNRELCDLKQCKHSLNENIKKQDIEIGASKIRVDEMSKIIDKANLKAVKDDKTIIGLKKQIKKLEKENAGLLLKAVA